LDPVVTDDAAGVDPAPDSQAVPAADDAEVETLPDSDTPYPGPVEIGGAGATPTAALSDQDPKNAPGLMGEVMTQGTIIEVLFSLALLAAVFAGVLYMGRHYLVGLRGDMDESQVLAHVSQPDRAGTVRTRGLPPGSAARVLSEVGFRYVDAEPPRELVVFDAHVRELVSKPTYQAALKEYRTGNYSRAAESWAQVLGEYPEDRRTIQLARVCTPVEIRREAEVFGPGFLLIKEGAESPRCFLVLWGVFPDGDAALDALTAMPGGSVLAPTVQVRTLGTFS